MGKLSSFDISVTNEQSVCNAGDLLTGYVSVSLNEDMKMRGVYIKFKGKGHVHFVKNKHTKNKKKCTASEYYFDEQVSLFNPEDNGGEHLEAGQHRFAFEYRLPKSLPSSFEGKYGYVRYYLKSHIDRPWKFDHTVKTAFTVISLLDLNTESDADFPVNDDQSKDDIAWCCVNEGNLTAAVNLPRRGFVPGEVIPITCEVKNFTRTSCTAQAELAQYITYHTTWNTKDDKYTLATVDLGDVEPQRSAVLRQNMTLPALPPSRLVGCSLIDILYVLKVRAMSSVNIKLPMELVIGTVPLHSVIEVFVTRRSPRPSPKLNGDDQRDGAQPSTSNGASTLFPPSYEEYMYGRVNIRDEDDTDYTMGALEYAPVYPCFKYSDQEGTRR